MFKRNKEKPRLVVAVRTNGSRPNYFKHCMESISKQTYRPMTVLIGCDDRHCSYIDKHGLPEDVDVIQVKYPNFDNKTDHGVAPYNYYLPMMASHAMTHIPNPDNFFFLILDDDDELKGSDALETIASKIGGKSRVLMWRVRLNKTSAGQPAIDIPDDEAWKYYTEASKAVRRFGGTIASCGYAIRGDCLTWAQWSGSEYGDFLGIDNVMEHVRWKDIVWINDTLAGIQRTDAWNGAGGGDDRKD